MHNARHDATCGRDVRFAADIAVSWFDVRHSYSVAAAEQSKIYVAGPPSLIERRPRSSRATTQGPGMICENLHSVRFVNGKMRGLFLDTLTEFAGRLNAIGEPLVLRPHPAGRFTDRHGVRLPDNVTVCREPLYELDLESFRYCISAPSTILFDFVAAGVPAAAWIDSEGAVDTSNFAGLPAVTDLEDWWRFHWASLWERDTIVGRQDDYLRSLGMPRDIRGRYQALLALA